MIKGKYGQTTVICNAFKTSSAQPERLFIVLELLYLGTTPIQQIRYIYLYMYLKCNNWDCSSFQQIKKTYCQNWTYFRLSWFITSLCASLNANNTSAHSYKTMDITPDLPFLNIHNQFTNERIIVDLDKHNRMSLNTNDYFIKSSWPPEYTRQSFVILIFQNISSNTYNSC